jgi:ABC-2 type transport system ATP-binding protein
LQHYGATPNGKEGLLNHVIEVQSLIRDFGSHRAVDTLSFGVKPGEVFALLGPNGAGKTTTIKMMLGMLRPTDGKILFNGQPLSFGQVDYKSRIGYVPESCALYETLSGREYLELVGNLHHMPPDRISDMAGQLLDALQLNNAAGDLIRTYSKGMKQKILIASALLHDPDLIILDEPFSGLDANAVAVFKQIIRESARSGKAVIFCSHILEVVERLVDRLLIIDHGRQLFTGTPKDVAETTGLASLDQAFGHLTGAADSDDQARRIVQIIRAESGEQKTERGDG